MNPKETYERIISKAKNRPIIDIGEVHHIIPRCIGGRDIEENLVKLSYREHYFCHYLLMKIYPESNGLKFAFNVMTNDGRHGKVISSKQYARFKEEFREMNSQLSRERLKDPEFAKPIRDGFQRYLQSEYNTNLQDMWNDPEYREYFTKLASENTKSRWEENPELMTNSLHKGKCAYYMWSHFCKEGIVNPTDEDILKGWKLANNTFSENWKEYFDCEQDWVTSVRNYINEYPIDITNKTERKQSDEQIRKRCRANKLSAFWKITYNGGFGKVINIDTIRYTKHWTSKSDAHQQSINWEKWFDDLDDWKSSILKYFEEYPIDGITFDL